MATKPTYALWAWKDQLLRHALITLVSKNITPYIVAASTAQHAWETLANLYANRSHARVITLKERLQNMRYDGRSVSEYLHTLKVMADELGPIDRPLFDDDLTVYILNGLDTKLESTPFTAHFVAAPLPPRAAATPFSSSLTFAGLLPTPHNGHFAHNCSFYRVQQHTLHANFASSPNIAFEDWLLNSGATHHVTTDFANLTLHFEYLGPDELQVGDGTCLKITHDQSIGVTMLCCSNIRGVYQVPSKTKPVALVGEHVSLANWHTHLASSIDIVCHRPVVDRSMLPPCATVPHHDVVHLSTKPAIPHSSASPSAPTSAPRSLAQSPYPTSTSIVMSTPAELDSSTPLSFNQATPHDLPPPSPSPPWCTHPMVTCSQNNIFKPKSLHHATMASTLPSLEPTCVSQALKDFHWRQAMPEEFNALIRQGTWEPIPYHPNQHVLGYKWIFRIKRGKYGSIERYKAHLVAKGFHQRADWARDCDTCLSTTGYIVFLGGNPLSWRVAKQHAVARSSTEVEYRALAASSFELFWVSHLLDELSIPITDPPALYCDNVSATYLSGNPVLHSRMKHITVDLHFVCDLVDKKVLRVSHIASIDQLADWFTKPFHSTRFICLLDKIGVADVTSILQRRVKETKSVS
ncbi:hypothetical protein SLEP1_g837 [Rubroshorea leprosula]|uniref:Reverse transcriptase Ty1/copia-type domain-containing protein n=1 Tax=Rubroshorea leprosula TaxID=152421 RepID=A0AAV5HKK9_9ROSI|nr:hypothetical protein SLEP1_g837 [Rubroshorea leprosula]